MTQKTKIKEIFASIQGEGPYVGYKQLFIRFCGCNLRCNYCDTKGLENEDYLEFTAVDLKNHLEEFSLNTVYSISLTGGEPLLWSDFLMDFLPLLKDNAKRKIYLETNATMKENLEKIIHLIDIISADIKLPSASGVENSFAIHDEFFKVANKYKKEVFAKVVFDENILDNEIQNCIKLAQKYNLELILQPKMEDDKLTLSSEKMTEIFEKFLLGYQNTRLIPQVHKFLGVI